ncbi:PREDICTED: collagen alpha-2(VI) chain-like, partial [Chinchilla lanigera]|uniref:collagen alpha-2(VI) chain-like n=1 Tax=Chinchilla lanigera TaxID=34839 RepID=UPI000696DBEB
MTMKDASPPAGRKLLGSSIRAAANPDRSSPGTPGEGLAGPAVCGSGCWVKTKLDPSLEVSETSAAADSILPGQERSRAGTCGADPGAAREHLAVPRPVKGEPEPLPQRGAERGGRGTPGTALGLGALLRPPGCPPGRGDGGRAGKAEEARAQILPGHSSGPRAPPGRLRSPAPPGAPPPAPPPLCGGRVARA